MNRIALARELVGLAGELAADLRQNVFGLGNVVPGAAPVDPRLARLTTMNLSDIASLIYDDHRVQRRQVGYAAKPYLEAMSTLQHIGDMYMQDTGSSVVAYLLGNLTSWKGDVARAVKKELNRRLR